jgi:photosystem II stability/assembly factor-like uncharacterized protein
MKTKILIILIFIFVLALSTAAFGTNQTDGWLIFFEDDFEDGGADNWLLETGWNVELEKGNYVLSGVEHNWVRLTTGQQWTDYSFKTKVKLIKGFVHLNYRVSNNGRYYIGFTGGSVSLSKETPWGTFYDLASCQSQHNYNAWYDIEIKGVAGNIKIYVNGVLKIDYTDLNPLYYGNVAFETLENSHVQFDDVQVMGSPPPAPLAGYEWTRTGGPSGGLGYDVRIHPQDKQIMFVTDNPSGVNKSYDGGNTWVPRNKGIKTKSGPSLDGVPNFALTIDPSSPNIIWAGMQFARGVYKSTDGGENWLKKDNGILEGNDITVRNFGIHPSNSDIVFIGVEMMRGELGEEFDKTAGKIYKTEDGGENWRCVWEGDNLARFILFDYHNPDILYASTGIFDREARNDIGVGILKSTDGGETWFQINNGIPNREGNRFCGFLEMHPANPEILFAACGNNALGQGGIFKTTNGGESWKKILADDIFTVVVISPSNPDIVYSGSTLAFYRSEDGGLHWKKFWKKNVQNWGPPGVRAGFPISAVVDPDDPYTLFVNNYDGGNFKSTDGAETWINASKGYTGAHMHELALDPENPGLVYSIARSGPFRSSDGGENWQGLAFYPLRSAEWNALTVNPQNSKEILISDEFQGYIFKSKDNGRTWEDVFKHPKATARNPQEDRHGFKAIVYAPSDSQIVYAGMRKGRRSIDGDFPPRPSFGMYKSIDGGESWFEINNGLKTSFININAVAVHPQNPDIVYMGTWRDGIFKTTDGGNNWQRVNNGLVSIDVRSIAIDFQNPDTLYAGLAEGVGIFKSTNGGELWSAVNNGISLVCPPNLLPAGRGLAGINWKNKVIKKAMGADYYMIPWTSIWSIVIDPTDSQTVYAGDHQSGVYVSSDGGQNWHPINEGLSTKAVTDLDISADGKVVYAATEGEGVFRMGGVESIEQPEWSETKKNIFQRIWEKFINFFKWIFRIK